MKKSLFMLLLSFSSFAQQETLLKFQITNSSEEMTGKDIICFYSDSEKTSMAFIDEVNDSQTYGPIKNFTETSSNDQTVLNFTWKLTNNVDYLTAKVKVIAYPKTGKFILYLTEVNSGYTITYTGIIL
jgi:hypothetical protein